MFGLKYVVYINPYYTESSGWEDKFFVYSQPFSWCSQAIIISAKKVSKTILSHEYANILKSQDVEQSTIEEEINEIRERRVHIYIYNQKKSSGKIFKKK
jgi:hypothetical protein